MRLSCQKASLLVVALTMACHESTAPPQRVSRLYLLENINGQPLPAVRNASPGDTTRILWATLILDAAGNAFTADHWHRAYPPGQTEEATLALRHEYRITGDSITIGSFKPCPPNAICLGNQVGMFTASTLTLTFANSPTAPLYLYRLAQTL